MSNNQPTPEKKDETIEEIIQELREKYPKKAKIKVISLKDMQTMYTRLGKVSNFHYIGAILCLIVALYFVQQGNQVVPFVLGLVMLLNMIFALLAYKATTKIEKILDLIQGEKRQKK